MRKDMKRHDQSQKDIDHDSNRRIELEKLREL
jgi:hypothetical protein